MWRTSTWKASPTGSWAPGGLPSLRCYELALGCPIHVGLYFCVVITGKSEWGQKSWPSAFRLADQVREGNGEALHLGAGAEEHRPTVRKQTRTTTLHTRRQEMLDAGISLWIQAICLVAPYGQGELLLLHTGMPVLLDQRETEQKIGFSLCKLLHNHVTRSPDLKVSKGGGGAFTRQSLGL